jgi:hypothetical protein
MEEVNALEVKENNYKLVLKQQTAWASWTGYLEDILMIYKHWNDNNSY